MVRAHQQYICNTHSSPYVWLNLCRWCDWHVHSRKLRLHTCFHKRALATAARAMWRPPSQPFPKAHVRVQGRKRIYCGALYAHRYAPPDPTLHYGGGQTLGNSYRISGDGGGWGPITQAVNVMANVVQYTHPGGYPDPDNILGPHGTVGRVTESQARVQMVLWSIMPTQLILGEDVTQMSDEYIETVGNEELIAVNQDQPFVAPAKRIVGGDLTFPCGQGINAPDINWTHTGAPVDIPTALWDFDGGAAGTTSKLPGQTDIRSGSPGQTSLALVAAPLVSLGHTITAATVSFEYISGYNCEVGKCAGASNLTLALVDAVNHTIVAKIWESPALDSASYAPYKGYSAPVTGGRSGLSVRWPRKTKLTLVMYNNQRNIQIPTSTVKMSITWGTGPPGPSTTH